MARSPKEPDDIEQWLAPLSPIELAQFCRRWTPLIYNVKPGNPKYAILSIRLVAKITLKREKTVKNWFYSSQKVPDDIKKYLGAVDALWRISLTINKIVPSPGNPEE
ncbi:hypothetical protein PCC7424_5477 (plasmid) [Gloeothece citriformis PCC 7424]|uniref:Uncharacterized protein n=1 Tax=Gloeothece citriformis (strain PCC 7424) TaxID=65393 RepID=B7KMM6_GLOC7|nr:hypothetical protein [Gloeothece citriformis]ACK74048.1 hypothetical protein PCC7424_5477 [Gloeothece citriformis PCC 7424]